MEEVGERLLQTAGEMTKQQALESFSKAELVEALVEYDSQWNFLDYQHSYENDYWLNFVVDLIMDGKIDADYWASRMPQVNPYPQLIKAFTERVQNAKHNLSEQEIRDAHKLLQQREEQAKQSQECNQTLLLVEQLRSKTETKH